MPPQGTYRKVWEVVCLNALSGVEHGEGPLLKRAYSMLDFVPVGVRRGSRELDARAPQRPLMLRDSIALWWSCATS